MTLQENLKHYSKLAIAFSGGVDSAYLLYMAKKNCKDVVAYYVKSCFQPEFELEDAKRLVAELEVPLKVIEINNLIDDINIACNSSERCYHCKRRIFEAVIQNAAVDGFEVIADGTNASDEVGDRPGMRVLCEMNVVSPLRESGLTKNEIRRMSEEAGLFTWNKPAYACLATRIPTGDEITMEKLEKIEKAENEMFLMGFIDFRIRILGNAAKIQVTAAQMEKVFELRSQLVQKLKPYFDSVLLDMEER